MFKRKIKKMSMIDYYGETLTFLEKNLHAKYKEIKKHISPISTKKFEKIISHLTGKNNDYLISPIQGYHKTKEDQFYEITPKGVDYLERLKSQHRERYHLQSNRVIALTGSIIAIVTLLNLWLGLNYSASVDTGFKTFLFWFIYSLIILIGILISTEAAKMYYGAR